MTVSLENQKIAGKYIARGIELQTQTALNYRYVKASQSKTIVFRVWKPKGC